MGSCTIWPDPIVTQKGLRMRKRVVKIGLNRKRFSLLVAMAVVYALVRVSGLLSCMSVRMSVSGVRSEARCILEYELDESIRDRLTEVVENIGRRQ